MPSSKQKLITTPLVIDCVAVADVVCCSDQRTDAYFSLAHAGSEL